MLDFHKLYIFLQVAKEGSFTAAAERLLMTQSAVSQHIADLEAVLGSSLFERSRRGASLTETGHVLLDYARRIMSLTEEAQAAATNVHNLTGAALKLAATPGVGVYQLPDWIVSFRARYPNVSVSLETDITPRVVGAVQSGAADLALIEGEIDPSLGGLTVTALQEVEQWLVVGKQHPWWGRSDVPVAELTGQTFITRQKSSRSRQWLEDALRRHGVSYSISAEFDNVETIKRSVAAGPCVTILPEYAIRQEQGFGVLHALKVEGATLQRTLKAVRDATRYFPPPPQAFLNHLRLTLVKP
ncbi:MAG: LysR substrate-binding domain-containing protein [Anaerolineae bacterium]|jgi:DNA-binding transcriptional LysR family regulator|nr:LysR substrate-binding domain-containing protein [Anaerolineae bacterium]